MLKQLLYATATGLMIAGFSTTAAIASSYTSSSGQTQLSLNEPSQATSTRGFYFTELQGKPWMGDVVINRIEGAAGHLFYSGSFSDRKLGGGAAQSCSGDILLDRTRAGSAVKLRAKWTIRGGSNCPSAVGSVFETNLTEALPRPDRAGNYTAANSITAISETNGNQTWPLWEVIAGDGKLNCRAQADIGSKVVFTYKTGDRLDARNRGAGVLETAKDGTSWMKIPRKQCFVRAGDRAIKPVSIPF